MSGGTSILVVEDDASFRLVCRVNLELAGFEVREAESIAEARRAVLEERPALVFLDVHLDSGDTDELLDEIEGTGVPVVLVSGTIGLDEYVGRASAVLAKPFEPNELVDVARLHTVG